MRLDGRKEADVSRRTRAWWTILQPDLTSGRPGDRATLARLRRAATPLEAAEEQAAVNLARALGVGPEKFEDVAVCAAILAHVRDDDPSTLVARRIGVDAEKPELRPLLTPLRFRRLVEARDAAERLTQFRRLVVLADQKLNVADLALAALDWSDRRRRDWIFGYYGGGWPIASSATPAGDAA